MLYFVFVYAFSRACWTPEVLAAQGVVLSRGLADFLASSLNPGAFGPLISAFVLTLLQQGGCGVVQLLKRGIDFHFKKIWLAVTVLVPFVLFGGAVWASVPVGVRPVDFSVVSNPAYAVIAFFVILLTAGPLQEEFGWRGYALPRWQSRLSAVTSSVILGFFWWLWHLPLVFIPDRFMADDLVVFLILSPVFVLVSIIFTWIFNSPGGSILACMLAHTSMNWSIWSAMPDMKLDGLTTVFMIAFLGAAVLIIVTVWGASRLRR